MATTVDIGADASVACPVTVAVAVQGGSVTIKNVAGATLTHYHGHNQTGGGTTSVGSSTTHNVPLVLLSTTGRNTITLTGAGY